MIWTDKAQNTNLPIPIPSPTASTPHQPKTLSHALSRAAKSGATELGAEDRLGVSLGIYGAALEKVKLAHFVQSVYKQLTIPINRSEMPVFPRIRSLLSDLLPPGRPSCLPLLDLR